MVVVVGGGGECGGGNATGCGEVLVVVIVTFEGVTCSDQEHLKRTHDSSSDDRETRRNQTEYSTTPSLF